MVIFVSTFLLVNGLIVMLTFGYIVCITFFVIFGDVSGIIFSMALFVIFRITFAFVMSFINGFINCLVFSMAFGFVMTVMVTDGQFHQGQKYYKLHHTLENKNQINAKYVLKY